MKKLVIFDLDGTLLNTIGDLSEAANHVLAAHALPGHTRAEFETFVGRGMRNLIKAALPEDRRSDGFIDSALAEFLDYYLSHIDGHTFPYPGMPELLSELQDRGYLLAVASNKVQAGAEALIAGFFPDIDFVGVLGNHPGCPLKPDAAVINMLMRKAGTDAAATTMVGDSAIDIATARNAGVRSVAVSWGFRPREDLAGADVICNDAGELLATIRRGEL